MKCHLKLHIDITFYRPIYSVYVCKMQIILLVALRVVNNTEVAH